MNHEAGGEEGHFLPPSLSWWRKKLKYLKNKSESLNNWLTTRHCLAGCGLIDIQTSEKVKFNREHIPIWVQWLLSDENHEHFWTLDKFEMDFRVWLVIQTSGMLRDFRNAWQNTSCVFSFLKVEQPPKWLNHRIHTRKFNWNFCDKLTTDKSCYLHPSLIKWAILPKIFNFQSERDERQKSDQMNRERWPIKYVISYRSVVEKWMWGLTNSNHFNVVKKI